MFTPAQYATLNHFAHTQNLRNCSIYPNTTEVVDIERAGDRLLATVRTEDTVKGIFHTNSVIAIGVRGAIRFKRTSQYVL